MKTEAKVKIKVYYDPEIGSFRTIRGVSDKGYIVSGGTEYYTDAKTTNLEEIMNEESFNNLIQIDNIEFFPFAEKVDLGFNGFHLWEYKISPKKVTLKQLEILLKNEVEMENYEQASKIRDQILLYNENRNNNIVKQNISKNQNSRKEKR